MDIVTRNSDSFEKRLVAFLKEKIRNRKILLFSVLVLCYSVFVFVVGGMAHKEGIFGEVIKPALDENIRLPFNFIRGLLSRPDRIAIDIKFKNYQKIARIREEALARGVLITKADDWVPARIRWKDKDVPAEIRLKGDLSDHWERDRKWSFRVKIKGNETVRGMKVFSIQHPRTRGFMVDWYLQELCVRFAGMMRLQYDFIEVFVNGEDLGIYCIEEFFDDMLLYRNHRINSPIIKLYDAQMWYNVDPNFGFYKSHLNEAYTIAPVDAFRTKKVNTDNVLLNNFIQAKNLLESWRLGKLSTHQVFDVDKLAKLFAIMDLFGYQHSTAFSNTRLYYNPVTSILEPIGYDETFIYELRKLEGQNKTLDILPSKINEYIDYNEYDIWYHTFFRDEVFFEKYIQALEELSDRKYLENFFRDTEAGSNDALYVLYRSFPGYSFKQKDLLFKNQETIRTMLDPEEAIQVYFKGYVENSHRLNLEVGNVQSLPVEILGVSLDGNPAVKPTMRILLNPKRRFRFIDFHEASFVLPENVHWADEKKGKITLNYRILGSDRTKSIRAFPWSHYDEDFVEKSFALEKPNIHDFPFFRVEEDRKRILIVPGIWNLSNSVIIPAGYRVYFGPKTTLNLSNRAKILSRSPMFLIGSEQYPITIRSESGTGQGIVILQTGEKSVFEHVSFHNLSEPSQGRWSTSGSVTFYESPFIMKHCTVTGDRASAALSVIRSDFHMDNVLFLNNDKDSVRVTYGNGSIVNSAVENGGGRGLLLSGTVASLENLVVKNVSGIGIGIDESSRIRGGKIEIHKTKTAIEISDKSEAAFDNVAITDCRYGIVAFRKRPEFGAPEATIANLTVNNLDVDYLVEQGAIVSANGREIVSDGEGNRSVKTYRRDL